MQTALFSPLGFDDVAHDSGYRKKRIDEDQRYNTSLRLSSYIRRKSQESTPDNPNSIEFHTVTHLHWKALTFPPETKQMENASGQRKTMLVAWLQHHQIGLNETNKQQTLAPRHGKMDRLKFFLKEGAFIDEYCVTSAIDTGEQDHMGTALHLDNRGLVDILNGLLEQGVQKYSQES